MAVQRGYRIWVAKPQIVKLIYLVGCSARGISLVYTQHERSAASAQHIGYVDILRRNAGADVGDKHNDVGRVNGDLGLLAHLRENHVFRLRLDAAGIYKHELMAAPLALGIQAVTGDTGGILND